MAAYPYHTVRKFLEHKPERKSNFTTDGQVLKTYNVVLAHWEGDVVILHPSVFHYYSRTSKMHQGALMAVIDWDNVPVAMEVK